MTQYMSTPPVYQPVNAGRLFTMVDEGSSLSDLIEDDYLEDQQNLGHVFYETDFMLVKYSDGAGLFNVVINSDGQAGLTPIDQESDVDVVAGSNGVAGYLGSYSATPYSGFLKIQAVANSGNYLLTLNNEAMPQAVTITIPNPASNTANFILSKGSPSGQDISDGPLNISSGSLRVGANGFVGSVLTYPTTASKGSLKFQASDNIGNTVTTLTNAAFGQTSSILISDPGYSVGYLNTSLVNSSSTPVGAFIAQNLTISYADLSGGGQRLIQTASGSMSFVIRDLRVSYSTGLSGGGGNRLLRITDGTNVFNGSGITSALLGTPVNTVWGGTGNPLPGSVAFVLPSVAGASIYATYTGGTTDYTAGSVAITVFLERIA